MPFLSVVNILFVEFVAQTSLWLDMAMLISRRQLLTLLATCTSTAYTLNACSKLSLPQKANKKQLNIYSWPDYIHPDTIPEFEKRYGIQVVYDTVSSNEVLIAKMQAGASDYDIVVPTNYGVRKLRELKLLQPIDKEKIPNFKFIMERFRNPLFDPHCQYSVPYTFGTTGIAYNARGLQERNCALPDDWDIFWDKRLGQRMTLLEDARETIGLALKRRGYSYNTQVENEIAIACQDLKIQKPLTMCYTSDQVIIYLASGDSVLSLAFSGDAHQAARTNSDVKYVIPKSGTSMWVDNMCIPYSAPHVENAHLWLNFMLDPEIAKANTCYTYYANPNQKAFERLPLELVNDKTLYPPESLLDKCEEIGDVGKTVQFYDRMWTELKCV
jgi:spermidine/putrescine transport system substrate-binding protein